MASKDRQYWGKTGIKLPPLNLTAVQLDSYRWFLDTGIKEALAAISPIEDFTGKNWKLEFGDHSLGQPKHSPSFAKEKGLSYEIPLKAQVKLTNKQTGEVTQQEVFLGDIPQMTDVGTFIINGIERAVVNQLVRSPGVFYSGEVDPSTGRILYRAELRPIRGSWLEFQVSRNDVVSVKIDRHRKFPVTVLLRAIGMSSDEEIVALFQDVETNKDHSYIAGTINKDGTKTKEEAQQDLERNTHIDF